MDIKKRERILLLAALACIVILTGDRFILTPMAKTWKKRSEKISLLKQNVEKGELLLDRREDFKERWGRMKKAGFSSNDPSDAENRILTRVNDWATRSGLTINSLKPRWVETAGEDKKLEFRLSASGDLEKVSRFLYELERDSLPLSLEDFGISVRDKQSRSLDFTARFTSLIVEETD
jgi:Tfp pilus assembly protein PilO